LSSPEASRTASISPAFSEAWVWMPRPRARASRATARISSSGRAAERMLEEGAYDAACTDSHRPDDVAMVAKAIERLRELVGREETELLLGAHPNAILEGTYEP
jgi:hypothetical protein